MERALVIMAAGMGSRFGGLKQIEPVDKYGHLLIDYSVYDAIRAGFGRVVFIIKREIEDEFKKIITPRILKWGIRVDYVFQELDNLPKGFSVPERRKKPWGTAHAIACLDGRINSPFAVINADDFYGREAFLQIGNALSSAHKSTDCFMVGYKLKNTLSINGGVSRGVCRVEQGNLTEIREVGGIIRQKNGVISSSEAKLDPDSIVSMNLWGLMPEVIAECKARLEPFLKQNLEDNPTGCEYYLPEVISQLIAEREISVRVIDCDEPWQGVTYREDASELFAFLLRLIQNGEYPENF